MKEYYLIFVSFILSLFLSTIIIAQESPILRLEVGGKQGEEFEPIIEQRGIASTIDIHVYPSNNWQSEISIAINPVDFTNLLIGANVVISGQFEFRQGYYYSFDSGLNWDGADVLPTGPYTSDPAVVFDADGNAYFNYIEQVTGIWFCRVKKSTDGGITWGVARTIPTSYSIDKNHMTADITNNTQTKNNLYVAFTDFGDNELNPIKFSRSINGSASYSIPQDISSPENGLFAQGVNLAVGPNGELYAVWAINDDWFGEICTPSANFSSDAIGFNKSTDGGENWLTPERIFDIDGSRDWWCEKCPSNLGIIRMNDFPVMAVDRSNGIWNGNIYIVWGAKGTGGDRADLNFSKSTDGGLSWSTPILVNDDATTNDQWLPWITVNPNGLINIVFYDSRNDPNNVLTEVWIAQSSDGGQSFTNFRASDIAFEPCNINGTAPGYMGDYIGITSGTGITYASWMDNRTGRYQVYVDIVDTYITDLLILAKQGKSLNSDATGINNGRRLAKDQNGHYHFVFTSGNHIFYRKSTNQGNTWSSTFHLSTDGGQNKYPSIASHGDFLFVTWQQYNGIQNNEHKYTVKGKWEDLSEETWHSMTILNPFITFSSETDPLPVIVAADNVDNNYNSAQGAPEVMIAFRKSDGIYHANLFYVIPSGEGEMEYTYEQLGSIHKIPNTFSGYANPSLTINNAGKIMLTGNSSWSLFAFTSTGSNWSAFPSSIFNVGGVIYPKHSSVTIDGLDDFQISWEGYKYTYGVNVILHKKILSNGGTGTPISEFRYTGLYYESHQPSTFGHLDGNGGVSIYWFTEDNEVKRVINDGTGWDYSGYVFVPSIQTDASYVNSISKDNPNNYAYCWTSTSESPYNYYTSIYDGIPGGDDPMSMGNDSLITYRSAEFRNDELDVVLALQFGNFVLIDDEDNRYQLDMDKLDESFTFEKFKDILNTLISDTIPNSSNLNILAFDYTTLTKNLYKIKAGNSNVKLNFLLKDIESGEVYYSSYDFILPADSSLTNISGTFEIPLNELNQNHLLSAELKLVGVKQSYLNQSENINLINTYLFGTSPLGKKSNKQNKTIRSYDLVLEQNYPNPFNPVTRISYEIPKSSIVTLKIYDVLGREIKILVNDFRNAGNYEIDFDASEFPSGVYFYKLQTESYFDTKKMILLK